jgi:hypothetical protein
MKMTDKEILDWCLNESEEKDYITFPDDIFNIITRELAEEIASQLKQNTLMKLPERELHFFKWLKQYDRPVWEDLWGGVDAEPYIVGISFLPLLVEKGGYFPICDLMEEDNFYFSAAHIIDKESKLFVESVKQRYIDKKSLTLSQKLILEISVAPLDIWHFAYRNRVLPDEAKRAARELIDENLLVHLTETEHIASFIDF